DDWCPGEDRSPPQADVDLIGTGSRASPLPQASRNVSTDTAAILAKSRAGTPLSEAEIVRLFRSRGDDFAPVVQAADALRGARSANVVSYVVNRNINYTNICYFKCQFCAFSKGKLAENLRGKPYDLSLEEIQRRTREAWERGATEVCMQGGIHPD